MDNKKVLMMILIVNIDIYGWKMIIAVDFGKLYHITPKWYHLT